MRRSRKKDDGDRSASGEAASRKDDLRGSRSQLVFLLVLGCCIAGLAGALIMFRYRSHGNSRGMLSADRWVAAGVFAGKRKGFFVEIGAHDGMQGSNTLSLEESLGWRGICIEAGGSELFAELQRNRPKCTTANLHDVVDEAGDAAEGAKHSSGSSGAAINTLLNALVEAKAPSQIDYFSLNAGARQSVLLLRAFPWDSHKVLAWTVEHNFEEANRKEIAEVMAEHDYLLAEKGDRASCPEEGGAWPCEADEERRSCPCTEDWFIHASLYGSYVRDSARASPHTRHRHPPRQSGRGRQ